jgi:acyl-coenzyme A synthetase/AMP-(fatty) acid ligase
VHSVGAPLNPEAVVWGQQALGLPMHDNWWQTETGGIMIANFAVLPIRPGSMGRPLPGIEAAIVRRVELLGFARQKLGSAVAPKEIAFQDDLPKTSSGKIMRRLLKARELGW